MKRIIWMVVASCMFWAGQALAVEGNVNFLLGQKTLDSSSGWNNLDYWYTDSYATQGEFGVLFDIRGDYWPVSIAADLLGSADQENFYWGDGTVSTSELDLGARKVFDIYGTSLHPYVGGGLALVSAKYEENDTLYGNWSTSDSGSGIWLNGGVYWTFGGHFNLGLDIRYSSANVTLRNRFSNTYETVDAGGTHSGLVLGYHW